jgi:adenylyltransferase/sulfurtransferase
MSFEKPYLPSNFLVWTEPPDEAGDEVCRIVSWRRTLTLKGHSFREFTRLVVPLLDGRTAMDRIGTQVADLFDRADLDAALAMLGEQGIVIEADPAEADLPARLQPQLSWLGEAAAEGRPAQARLNQARVAIFGCGGPGAVAARSLAASGVGQIVLIDPAPVTATDGYFSAQFRPSDLGRNRAEVLAEALAAAFPDVQVTAHASRPETPDDVARLVGGAALVLCALDAGELNLILKLNRACRDRGIRWLAGAMEGIELVVGPGFSGSGDAACYMCWRMREVACASSPAARFALERRLDRLKEDLSGRRENLAAGADIVGGMMAAEALAILTEAGQPSLDGRFLTLDLPGLSQQKHVVLRKPGCPVCGTP